ncbi:hypothetical protein BDV27DRAFT_25880 [Aspergillus caelatus]|uniref:Zn(2)-C6 fungal-type domain-containing protein n=1 Tax=Aspergillus caelatus TaxID=61420 RepID=A0A5N6ZXX4_9EURO|nr:uncharacterized protein BDV27DRAFT_25880 [Aspergillus caelatus]KAE8361746.1 hypothetical protein BDV27DRAFT_25880 [Aspergillus caelatus]
MKTMFTTLLSDSKNQSLVAVEESSTPPVTNRSLHVVCQLCRRKKLKCSGYSPDSCLRCRESGAECLPVEPTRRENITGRPNGNIRRGRSMRPQPTKASTKMSSLPDRFATSLECIDTSDIDLPPNIILTASADILAASSLSTPLEECSSSSSGSHDALCLNPYDLGTSESSGYLGNGEFSFHPAINRDIVSEGTHFLNPETFNFTPSSGETRPSLCEAAGPSLNSLSWQETFDMMIRKSWTAEESCQCTDRALELLDQVFMQDCDTTDQVHSPNSITPSTIAAIQSLSSLRKATHGLEHFATCGRCRQAPRLMTLLVLLSERLSTKLQKILEIAAPDIFHIRKDVPSGPGPILSSQNAPTLAEDDTGLKSPKATPQRHTRRYTAPEQRDDIKMNITLFCEGFTLDMTKEKEALVLTWSLLAIKQLRRIVAILWDRAQKQSRRDFSESLARIGHKIHALDCALKSTLTADSVPSL